MSDAQQLDWEARHRSKAAIAAFISGAFTLAALVIQRIALGGAADNEREGLLRIHDHQGGFLLSLVAQAVAVFMLAAALAYLVRAVLARRPEGLRFLWPLVALAPVLLTTGAVLTQIDLGQIADEFVSKGAQTTERAKDLIDGRDKVGGLIASAGTLCLALSYVLVSVNGMRAGLLSRFMGIVGIIAGALLVIPILPGNVIQTFWIVALGALFLDRWPNGRGPAWDTVEAIPWPGAAQARGPAQAGGEPRAEPVGAGDGAAPEPEPAERRPSRKKKRKR